MAAQSAHGQANKMSLTGNVQSTDRKALPGAAITVIHVPSGVRYAASSSATGRFEVPNLQAGGPYLLQVGEGGYRPQTVESIFLENGKSASLTVTLSRLAGPDAGRANQPTLAAAPTEVLAPESVVGGPVYVTTVSPARAGASAAAAPAVSAPPAEPAVSAAPAPAGPAARYRRRPYTPGKPYVPKKVTDPIVPGHFDAKTGNYIYHTGAPTTLKLPNGASIAEVGASSTESYLYRFLSDPAARVDTADLTQGWYNFDRVFFMPGKATLAPESVGQLRNIAALLKAYPTARIKLGGYTDSTGTYKVNKQLSEARARTAWASLVEMGISPGRIDARGYGPRYAIAPNTSEEGRAMNRRLSVKVLQK
ncbi:OmpA family protein [Hymenobacter sp. BT189]|uniref:OmpA family protein n=1 Tax=Hymenobacter armeniacus TaxID=2771358 RepID=A0ABR8JX11_9BACT|nr:OmpA family protein [Hymenobacter armeniacus]